MSRTLLVIHPGTGTVLNASECVVVTTVIPGRVQEVVERGDFDPSKGQPVLDPWQVLADADGLSVTVRPFALEISPQDEGVCIDVYAADEDGYCVGQPIDSLYVAANDIEVGE